MSWAKVAGRIQRSILRPPDLNPHMVLLAMTRGGKDHLIRWGILPAFPLERVVVLVTKHGEDKTWRGWGNVIAPDDLRPGFGVGPDGTPRYLVPLSPGKASRDEAKQLLDQFAAVGEMILIVGDAARLTQSEERGGLGCEGRLSQMMADGAGNSLTIIACANSSAWAASGIKDQASAVLIGRTRGDMRDKFADIASLPERRDDPGPRRALDSLRPHWWLYTDNAGGDLLAGITTPPPAGWCSEAWPPPEQLTWPTAA